MLGIIALYAFIDTLDETTQCCVGIVEGCVRCIALHDMHVCMAARTPNSPVRELAETRFQSSRRAVRAGRTGVWFVLSKVHGYIPLVDELAPLVTEGKLTREQRQLRESCSTT